MSNGIKTELRIPDLWYDFYARVLPGAAFVAALRLFVFSQELSWPGWIELIIFFFAGYFCGLIIQPISSELIALIEFLIEIIMARDKKDQLYIRKVQDRIGRTSNESMVLSKMHGEAVFFVQLFFLGLLFLGIKYLHDSAELSNKTSIECWIIIFVVFCIAAAVAVAFRRFRRAIAYDKSIKKSPRRVKAKIRPKKGKTR